MSRPAQGHHEEPGLDRPAGGRLDQRGPHAEIDLGRFAGLKVQAHGRRHLLTLRHALQKATH